MYNYKGPTPLRHNVVSVLSQRRFIISRERRQRNSIVDLHVLYTQLLDILLYCFKIKLTRLVGC